MTYYEQPEPVYEPGPEIAVDITLKAMDTTRLFDAVVSRIAETLLASSGYRDSDVEKRVAAMVEGAVLSRLQEVAQKKATEILSAGIVKRDAFGDVIGEASTIEKIVETAAQSFLTEQVDEKGAPSKDRYRTTNTRIEWLVRRAVLADLDKTMKGEADKLRAELAKRATAAVAEMLTKVGAR